MSPTDRPIACACTRSTSSLSCGEGSSAFGRTPTSALSWPALPSSVPIACISASRPWPVRSCRYMSKPPNWPSPFTVGRLITKICASRIGNSAHVRLLDEIVGGDLALVPRLELDEHHADVLALADEAEAGDLEHAVVAFLLLDHLRAPARTPRRCDAGLRPAATARWRARNPGLPRAGSCPASSRTGMRTSAASSREHDHPARRMAHGTADVAHVGRAHPPVEVVEPAEDRVAALVVHARLEQVRAQRRGEAEREEGREQHRHRDGQRELLVHRAGAARLQRARDEHRRQHQRDRDHRAGDLVHRLARGFLRRQAFLGHDPLDVLDHHDRVVDHDADRQHHAEQAELVDREAEHLHAEERAEQRDRDDQRRDQRGAQVLQEQQHHQEHQHHRLGQRLDHLVDRDAHEVGAVVRREPLHALAGSSAAARAMRCFTAAATASAFSPGASCTAKPAAGWPFHFRSKPCAAPEISTRATSFRRTAAPPGSVRSRICSNCSGVLKRPSAETVAVNICVSRRRLAADLAGGELHVLPAHRRQHLAGRQAVGVQLVRIEPDMHRVLAAEQLGVADAGHARDLVEHVGSEQVGQLVAADRRIARTSARRPAGSPRSTSPPPRPAAPRRWAGAASPATPCSAPASARCRDRCRA